MSKPPAKVSPDRLRKNALQRATRTIAVNWETICAALDTLTTGQQLPMILELQRRATRRIETCAEKLAKQID